MDEFHTGAVDGTLSEALIQEYASTSPWVQSTPPIRRADAVLGDLIDGSIHDTKVA